MSQEIFETSSEAFAATDEFYRSQSGFGCDMSKVTGWLTKNVPVPASGRREAAVANCDTIRLKVLKLRARNRIFVRRVKLAFASRCRNAAVSAAAARRLSA